MTLRVRVTGILAVTWAGLFAYEFAPAFLLAEQLFILIALDLFLGTALTIAVLWWSVIVARQKLEFEEISY